MPRLGELLVAARMLTTEQIEQALRAQVVWGGRLGTNLVELKLVDLDGLTRILGRQHGLPAALAHHFEKSDPELQARFPADLAGALSVVPLVRFGEGQIAIAAIDPLDLRSHAAVADAFGIDPANLIVSIAAELRIRYHLERVYHIPRTARFLRSKGQSDPPFPHFDDLDVPLETDPDAQIPPSIEPSDSVPVAIAREQTPKQADADDLAVLIDEAVNAMTMPPAESTEPSGRERRRYVKTLAEPDRTTIPLGRIPIRRIANPAPVPRLIVEDRGPGETLADAMRAIRRAPHRDRVAELVIATLERFAPTCDAAIMLVVRGEVAIGWKWFARADLAAPELAVPVDQPGLVPRAIASRALVRISAGGLGAIDQRLLAALGKTDGELAVVPITIGDRVMCLIAVATGADASLSSVEEIANAAGIGFARLIRDASR